MRPLPTQWHRSFSNRNGATALGPISSEIIFYVTCLYCIFCQFKHYVFSESPKPWGWVGAVCGYGESRKNQFFLGAFPWVGLFQDVFSTTVSTTLGPIGNMISYCGLPLDRKHIGKNVLATINTNLDTNTITNTKAHCINMMQFSRLKYRQEYGGSSLPQFECKRWNAKEGSSFCLHLAHKMRMLRGKSKGLRFSFTCFNTFQTFQNWHNAAIQDLMAESAFMENQFGTIMVNWVFQQVMQFFLFVKLNRAQSAI